MPGSMRQIGKPPRKPAYALKVTPPGPRSRRGRCLNTRRALGADGDQPRLLTRRLPTLTIGPGSSGPLPFVKT